MTKIKSSVADYGDKDTKEKWIIDFEVGVDFESLTLEEIIVVHERILKTCSHLEQMRLLAFSERVRLYHSLKYSTAWSRRWLFLCKKMKVCHTTVSRYIDFHTIVKSYPQLMICGINFESIMFIYTELSDYLDREENH